jgi:hypothetical protein
MSWPGPIKPSCLGAILCLAIAVAGCGATEPKGHRSVPTHIGLGGESGHRLEADITSGSKKMASERKALMLARMELPGGTTIKIAARRCAIPASCYEFAEYQEEPAKYVRWAGKKNGMVNTGLVATGPAITQAGPAERTVLNLIVEHGCSGPYSNEQPYALAHGLLRNANDRVIDRVDGRSIRLHKATIPTYIHPEGVLVYGLLPRGTNNIVVQAPSGKIISSMNWAGSNEGESCSQRARR